MWRALIPRSHRVPFGRLIECAAFSAFAWNSAPLAGGQISSTALLAGRAGLGGSDAVATSALEILAEALVKVGVIALAMMLAPVPGWMRDGFVAVVVTVCIMGAMLVTVAHMRQRASGSTLRRVAARFANGLEALRQPRRLAHGVGFTGAMTLAEVLAILCVQRAFGVTLPLSTLPLLLSATMLATLVPVVPGNFGTYEAAAFLVYEQLGVPAEIAATLALTQHLALLAAFASASGIALLLAYPRAAPRRLTVVSAITIWITLLCFAAVIGVLALVRGFGGARHWKRMRTAGADARTANALLRRSA
jgi:uncharacterized membrane protein YbhN (UPF0104 family)